MSGVSRTPRFEPIRLARRAEPFHDANSQKRVPLTIRAWAFLFRRFLPGPLEGNGLAPLQFGERSLIIKDSVLFRVFEHLLQFPFHTLQGSRLCRHWVFGNRKDFAVVV